MSHSVTPSSGTTHATPSTNEEVYLSTPICQSPVHRQVDVRRCEPVIDDLDVFTKTSNEFTVFSVERYFPVKEMEVVTLSE
jgi:hypothetical protein